MKKTALLILVLIAGATAGFGLQRAMTDRDSVNPPLPAPEGPAGESGVIGQKRPEFALADLEGQLRHISEWDGKVLLVNFWATWCPPCKNEIPAFMALQEQYGARGFQIIGVAIDDEQAVKDYADTVGINYPVMAAELDSMDIARRYGNRINALPFSVFVGRDGKIAVARPGEISREYTERIIQSLL